MTTDFVRLNQVVTPNEAVMPNVLSLLEGLIWPQAHAILPLNWSTYSFPSPSRMRIRSKLNSDKVNKHIYLLSCFISCVLYQNIIRRDLDHPYVPHNTSLDHYIDDFMLIRPNEQKVVSTLKALVSVYFLKD